MDGEWDVRLDAVDGWRGGAELLTSRRGQFIVRFLPLSNSFLPSSSLVRHTYANHRKRLGSLKARSANLETKFL